MHKPLLPSETIKPNQNQLYAILFFILIPATVIQQMPVIRDVYYDQIRFLLYLGFGILSFFSILNFYQLFKHKIIMFFLLCIVYLMLLFLVAAIFRIQFQIGDIFELLVPFGVLLCSLNTSFNETHLEKILTIYIFMAAILGITSIFYYGEGFVITRTYFLKGKNQVGPLLGISGVITAYRIFSNIQNIKVRSPKYVIGHLIVFFSLISSIIVIRNRSGLLALAIVIILIISREFKIKLNFKSIFMMNLLLLTLILLIVTGSLKFLLQPFIDAFILNYNIADLNSISAGRVEVYESAISYILTYPMFGEFSAIKKFNAIPHNYILNKWVRYGIIGSLPLIIFYLFLWFFVFRGLKKSYSSLRQKRVVLWILLFSLIVSLFEYTYPFGPGTSQIMLWFLLGQYLREYNVEKVFENLGRDKFQNA